MHATAPQPETATPPAAARRGRPGYDRAQVVDIAVQLFNEQGYDATSVADLAGRLGLTKSALYHHVDSKESILSTALDDALTALESVLDEAAAHFQGRVTIAKLNVDENPDSAAKYGIRGIPTLMLFKNGQVAATKVGALSRTQLQAFLDEAL